MWIVVLKAMAPSFGATNSTGTPRAFRIWMALKLPGEISIWPCWNRVASAPGLAATAARLGFSSSNRLEAGIDIGFRTAAHLGDLDQPAGAERRVKVGDAN